MQSVSVLQRFAGVSFAGILFFLLLTAPRTLRADGEELMLFSGEALLFGVETDLSQPSFSWVLESGGNIVTTQGGRFFQNIFPVLGESTLHLTMRGANGVEEKHVFSVRVEAMPTLTPAEGEGVRAVLRTEPPAGSATEPVLLPPEGGTLLLHMNESTGAIRQYRLDVNTDADTDGDGDSAHDADNQLDPSFTSGGSFAVNLAPAPGEQEREILLQVLGMSGEKSEARLRIRFDPTEKPDPRLTVFPAVPGTDALILPAEGGIVRLDASASLGGIRRYALDLDLASDTDGDGNAENDNDVEGTSFAEKGTPVTLFLRPLNNIHERRIAVIVWDGAGRTATLVRELRFGAESIPGATGNGQPSIVAEGKPLVVGRPFTLRVLAPPAGAVSFQWDMTGDGIVDAETMTPTVRLEPDAPGMLPVRVAFKDASGISLGAASLQETVLAAIPAGSGAVLSPLPEGAIKIDVVAEGLHVTLQPVFAAASPVTASGQHLSSLAVLWSFGDGTTSYLLTPEHTYAAEGAYDVILTFRDMASGMDIATASTRVTVQPGMAPLPTSSLGLRLFRSILSFARILLFSLLVLFLLLGLFLLPIAFLAQRKGVSLREALRNPKKLLEKTTEAHAPPAVMPEILAAAPVQTPEVSSSEAQPFALQQEESIEEETSAETSPPPSTDQEISVEDELPAETESATEQENIPPWLQVQAEEVSATPPPPPPIPENSAAPVEESPLPEEEISPASLSSPTPESVQPTATVVPPWLQKGLMKAAETAPSSTELPTPAIPSLREAPTPMEEGVSPPLAIEPSSPPAPMPVAPTEDIVQEIPVEKNAEELPVAENKTVDESDVAPISTDEPIAIVRAEVEDEKQS